MPFDPTFVSIPKWALEALLDGTGLRGLVRTASPAYELRSSLVVEYGSTAGIRRLRYLTSGLMRALRKIGQPVSSHQTLSRKRRGMTLPLTELRRREATQLHPA